MEVRAVLAAAAVDGGSESLFTHVGAPLHNERVRRLERSLVLCLVLCGCHAPPTRAPTEPQLAEYPPPRDASDDPTPSDEPDEDERIPSDDQRVPNPELAECPMRFDMQARSRWHEISGEQYYIDEYGRPARAVTTLPPAWPDAPRDAACQRDVGGWGDATNPSEDYDGGHLLGYQLGGWSARANLVPQAASFNRGNWAQIENALARCTVLDDGQLGVEVVVDYPDSITLIPVTMRMNLEDRHGGATLELVFENAGKGGPSAATEREHAVAWLRALGCL